MSYSSRMLGLKTELEANATIQQYDCPVNIKIENRNDSVRHSAFAIDLMLPDGVFIEPRNETVSNDNATDLTTLDAADLVRYTYRFNVRAMKNGFSDEGELLDSDILKGLDLVDKVRNSCGDYFFKNDLPGCEFGNVSIINEEGQAGIIFEFDFILTDQICIRSR